jgi:NADP-dependent 3-hydroxy acid dehydrogenase YdfG
MSQLKDQIALVTGASGGIGCAIAQALADQAARLVLVGRDAQRLYALAERVRGRSPEVDVQVTDLGDDTKLRRLVARVLGTFGGIDILVHAAGLFAAGPVESAPVEDLDRLFRLNTRAPYLLTQLLLGSLRSRQGQVVFINSSAGGAPRAGIGAYAASKAALKALADSLRSEVNREGIRVLSVFPGRTATPMQQEVQRLAGKAYEPERLLQPADVAAAVVNALCLPRTAEVTDLNVRPMQPAG